MEYYSRGRKEEKLMIIPTYNIFISHVKIDEDNGSFFIGIMVEYFGKLMKDRREEKEM